MEFVPCLPNLLANSSVPSLLVAAAGFPRGPGFYFSIFKLIFLLAGFLAWVYICNAVQKDSDEVQMSAETWNGWLLGAGVLGLFLVWLCGSIWVALIGMTILTVAAVIAYSYRRDRYAPIPFWQQFKKMFQEDERN